MTTSIPEFPLTATTAHERVALRLQVSDHADRGAVDGSWWPQSRDLAVEIPDLVDHFPQQFGEVHRVVFSRPDWDDAPHRVRVARGLVKVGSYPRDDIHQVWLSMSTGQLIRLSVHPPEQPSPEVGHEPLLEIGEHWTDEGDSWWASHRVPPSYRL